MGILFLQVISPCRHWLVNPSLCFVFGHRSTQVATEICLTSIDVNPTGTVLTASVQCLVLEEWFSFQFTLRHWRDPIGFDSTSSHFWAYCCFLEFSLVSILESFYSRKDGHHNRRDGAVECAESAGRWNTLPLSHYVSPNIFLGLEPSQFS